MHNQRRPIRMLVAIKLTEDICPHLITALRVSMHIYTCLLPHAHPTGYCICIYTVLVYVNVLCVCSLYLFAPAHRRRPPLGVSHPPGRGR